MAQKKERTPLEKEVREELKRFCDKRCKEGADGTLLKEEPALEKWQRKIRQGG
jgi:hypothetical protein